MKYMFHNTSRIHNFATCPHLYDRVASSFRHNPSTLMFFWGDMLVYVDIVLYIYINYVADNFGM